MRQPVIAHVFEAPSETMVRACIPGRLASDSNVPEYGEPRIDLVGEDPDLRMAREDCRDGVEIGAAQHAARGIVRRVENEELRLRGDLRFEVGRIESELSRLAEIDRAPAARHWRGSAIRRSETRAPDKSPRRPRRSP
jgi:hypothetical protein